MFNNNNGAVIVSACLIGIECRYDGGDAFNKKITSILRANTFFPVCPEQLGGLGTPRMPSVLSGGDGEKVWQGTARVINSKGEDVTEQFIRGAREVLKLAKMFNVKKAYLKSKSPSCGCGSVYINGKLAKGSGVLAYLLRDHGIEVTAV